jgi:hypothetical protein
MSYEMPPVGRGLEWVIETWRANMRCITETNGVPDPGKIQAGRPLTIPGSCLDTDSDGLTGWVIFAADSQTERRFALNIKTGEVFSIGGEDAVFCDTRSEESSHSIESPDGEWIAYIDTQEGTTVSRFGDLWVESREGAPSHQLTFGYCAADPVWSPNGRYIAFTSQCEVTIRQDSGLGELHWQYRDGLSDIWVIPAPETVSESVEPAKAGHIVLIEGPGLERVYCWRGKLE